MMKPDYPNLELLEYMAAQFIADGEGATTPAERKALCSRFSFLLYVFPQSWGSTCGGFDLTEDGLPAFGGSAMTTMYTTVIHESLTDSYVVFFGNRPCYRVTEPNVVFYRDLHHRKMASLSESKKRY